MVTLILVAIVVAIIWAVVKGIHDGKVFADQKAQFQVSHKGWDTFASLHNKGLVAINREQGKIVLGSLTRWKEYSLAQITSVELLRDGSSVSLTNRGSQAAGALIGGLALGGVGLLLGGLSGSKRNTQTLHSVMLKVIVDDQISPVHTIEFFKSPSKQGTNTHSALIKPSLQQADRFHALLVNAVRAQTLVGTQPQNNLSELQKLWELKQAGALTDEEFASQKEKLLAQSSMPATTTLATAVSSNFAVVLTNAGDRKINLIKEIRSITGMGLKETKDIVEGTPSEVMSNLTQEEANRIRNLLERAGAAAQVV